MYKSLEEMVMDYKRTGEPSIGFTVIKQYGVVGMLALEKDDVVAAFALRNPDKLIHFLQNMYSYEGIDAVPNNHNIKNHIIQCIIKYTENYKGDFDASTYIKFTYDFPIENFYPDELGEFMRVVMKLSQDNRLEMGECGDVCVQIMNRDPDTISTFVSAVNDTGIVLYVLETVNFTLDSLKQLLFIAVVHMTDRRKDGKRAMRVEVFNNLKMTLESVVENVMLNHIQDEDDDLLEFLEMLDLWSQSYPIAKLLKSILIQTIDELIYNADEDLDIEGAMIALSGHTDFCCRINAYRYLERCNVLEPDGYSLYHAVSDWSFEEKLIAILNENTGKDYTVEELNMEMAGVDVVRTED